MAKLTGKDKELCDELTAVLKKHGYTVNKYLMSHDSSNARFTINTMKPGVTTEDKYVTDWNTLAGLYGLKKEWLGQRFLMNGEMVKILGLYVKGRKDPTVVFETPRGAKRIVAPEVVVARMPKAA